MGGVSLKEEQMNSQDIYIENFRSSMHIAQRALYAGIIVSIFSFFLVSGYFDGGKQYLPLLNLEIKSQHVTVPGLALVYFYCGVQCVYFVLLAKRNLINISSEDVLQSLLLYPSTLFASFWWQAFLAPILLGIWYQIFMLSGIVSSLAVSTMMGACVSFPFFAALKYGSRIKEKS